MSFEIKNAIAIVEARSTSTLLRAIIAERTSRILGGTSI